MKKNTRKEEQLYAEFLRRMTEYNREEDFGAGMFRSVILAAVVVTIVTAAIYFLIK
jgi:hypothetical protein